jgi:hypothetical protein
VSPHGITNLQVMSIVPPDPTAWGVNEEEARSRNYRRSEGYRHHKLVYARSLIAAALRRRLTAAPLASSANASASLTARMSAASASASSRSARSYAAAESACSIIARA